MAYNPSLYNPYGMQMQPSFQQMPMQQQAVNGLVFIDKNAIDTYQMPPGSVSPPLFVDDSHYVIKSFDSNGGSSIEPFKTEPCPMSEKLRIYAEEWAISLLEKHGLEAAIITSQALGRPLCISGFCI